MRRLPRFAVGTIQPGASREPATWALVAALAERGFSPAVFRSSLAIATRDPAQTVLGRASRHLDSWAMSRSDAIAALARGAGQRDTAIVEGSFSSNNETHEASSLDRLCQWLDLPRLAIIDVRELASRGLTMPPKKLAGVLLDRVSDAGDAAYWQTTLETLWKTPVVGWLEEAKPLRTQCSTFTCSTLPADGQPSRELCEALGRKLLPTLRVDRLRQIGERATELPFEPEPWLHNSRGSFRIAVAMDEAFCGYYPETLDLLEEAGAELCDFSPLRSERIPDHVEVVYFGRAEIAKHAEQLAANHCLLQSLRGFASEGGRIYAQGSSLPYMCRDAILSSGTPVSMTGLLPMTARAFGDEGQWLPAAVTLGVGSWLAPQNVSIRGYRQSGWQFESRGPVISYATSESIYFDIFGRGNVIGSRVLINLAANRHLLRRFFEPYSPILSATRRLSD
jgi:cobyrinic acid a,c-diamide synthase